MFRKSKPDYHSFASFSPKKIGFMALKIVTLLAVTKLN